ALEAEYVEKRGRAGKDTVPRLLREQLVAFEPQAPKRAISLVRLESLDLNDTEALQCGQDVLDQPSPAYDGHLVHLSDHGRTFSMTIATASSRFARACADRASAALFAALTTVSRAASASCRPASVSTLAISSDFAFAASRIWTDSV